MFLGCFFPEVDDISSPFSSASVHVLIWVVIVSFSQSLFCKDLVSASQGGAELRMMLGSFNLRSRGASAVHPSFTAALLLWTKDVGGEPGLDVTADFSSY